MIKRFEKITGTGKFLQFKNQSSESSSTDFGKLNLIYGDNGSGKTTLAILLKSLAGDDNLLGRKRSFDQSVPQEIKIITTHLQNPIFEFQQQAWNQHLPEIEVFDVHYVNDNIYTGLEIQNTHKKNLFEIILGKRGVELKEEIAVLKSRISKGNKVIRETGKLIEAKIGTAFSVLEYCETAADPEVVEKIKWKEQEIEAAENVGVIQQKPFLQKLPEVKLPYDLAEAQRVFAKSIDGISDDFLNQFSAHKNHLDMGGRSEEWIQQGYLAMQENECPFCKQAVDDSTQIIAVYRQYFNEEYRQLLQQISGLEKSVSTFNLEAVLLEIENKISSNLLLIDFWKTYVTASVELKSIAEQREGLVKNFVLVKEAILQKSKNPIQSQSSDTLQVVDNQLVKLNETLTAFNEKINLFNEGIETLKAADAPNLAELKTALDQLKAIQKRDEAEIVESCDNVLKYTKGVENLRKKMKDKQAELDIFKQTLFVGFGDKVNFFLNKFAPYLALKNLGSSYLGSSTDPAVKFGLYVDGKALNQKKNAVEATIKYSLSEGDKTALALSFFFAKLELDEDLENKIVVMDDPISNFDAARKAVLLEALMKVGERVEQVFLLTHDKDLAKDFTEISKNKNLEIRCYEIGFDGRSASVNFE